MGHLVAEDRRRVALFADDGADIEGELPAFVGFEVEVRDVDAEMPLAEVVRQPAPAVEIDFDLTNAVVERDVERGAGSAIDRAGGRQPMVLLEHAHRAGKRVVVTAAFRAGRGQLAGGGQPAAQGHDSRM
jgi:hypothetical protein